MTTEGGTGQRERGSGDAGREGLFRDRAERAVRNQQRRKGRQRRAAGGDDGARDRYGHRGNASGTGGISGSAQITLAAIAPGACGEATLAVAGAAEGDAMAPGWTRTLCAGLIGIMRVTGRDTISLRLCNLTGTPVLGTAPTLNFGISG